MLFGYFQIAFFNKLKIASEEKMSKTLSRN